MRYLHSATAFKMRSSIVLSSLLFLSYSSTLASMASTAWVTLTATVYYSVIFWVAFWISKFVLSNSAWIVAESELIKFNLF